MSDLKSRAIFAAQMKKYRVLKKMTLELLRDKTGLSYNYLSAVENGRNNISMDNAERIAKALEVSLAVLLIRDNF